MDMSGIFHELFTPGFPAQMDRMVLAVVIEWNAGEVGHQDFRIDLLDPSASPAFTISGHTEVHAAVPTMAPPRSPIIMELEEVRFMVGGTYLFQLFKDDESTVLAPLHIIEDPNAA